MLVYLYRLLVLMHSVMLQAHTLCLHTHVRTHLFPGKWLKFMDMFSFHLPNDIVIHWLMFLIQQYCYNGYDYFLCVILWLNEWAYNNILAIVMFVFDLFLWIFDLSAWFGHFANTYHSRNNFIFVYSKCKDNVNIQNPWWDFEHVIRD